MQTAERGKERFSELDGLWGRSLESTSCSPTVVLEGTQDVMSSFS